MPWQRLVAEVGTEYDPDTGIPHYREIIVTVPRQSGKTTVVLALECDRAIAWPTPQRVGYTAQTGWDARRKLIDDQAPMLMSSPLKRSVARVLRGTGNEAILFRNGSRIDVMASSDTAGHGRTLDLGVIDEAFSDTDDRREQALLPAMVTKKSAQLLVVSTAGTEASTYLRRKVDAGRDAVDRGVDSGIAYFEWSADPDADIDDPETWWSCMPALGHTVTEQVIRHARATMSEGEFRRAFLNQWTTNDERIIPPALWETIVRPDVSVTGGQALAVDAHADRSSASIALADSEHRAKIVAHQVGESWLLPMLSEHARRLRVPVAIDMRGPIPHLADDLEKAGVEVVRFQTADMVRACSRFWELLGDSKLAVKSAPPLDAAVESAAKRPVGDAWLWSRPQSVDASPLVALTMALEAASGRSEWKGPPAVWV